MVLVTTSHAVSPAQAAGRYACPATTGSSGRLARSAVPRSLAASWRCRCLAGRRWARVGILPAAYIVMAATSCFTSMRAGGFRNVARHGAATLFQPHGFFDSLCWPVLMPCLPAGAGPDSPLAQVVIILGTLILFMVTFSALPCGQFLFRSPDSGRDLSGRRWLAVPGQPGRTGESQGDRQLSRDPVAGICRERGTARK